MNKMKGQTIMGFSMGQWVLILLAVVGVILFIIYHNELIAWAQRFIASMFGGG
jgi:hypothetical protein